MENAVSFGYYSAPRHLLGHSEGCWDIDKVCRELFPYADDICIQEEQDMSFVGITAFADKMIAFGDSKSTKMEQEKAVADLERGAVMKVFKTDQFLMATFGCNEIILHPGRAREQYQNLQIPIEHWIEDHIYEAETPEKVCNQLTHFLSQGGTFPSECTLVFGMFENGAPVFTRAVFKAKEPYPDLFISKPGKNSLPAWVCNRAGGYCELFEGNKLYAIYDENELKQCLEGKVTFLYLHD